VLDTCPLCRAPLDQGAANCARCGARIAPLPRRQHQQPAAAPAATDTAGGGDLRWADALRRGLLGGLVVLAVSTVIAGVWSVARGQFLVALSNGAAIIGGVTLMVSLILGGVRVARWGEFEKLRRHARGADSMASGPVRLAVAVAGLLPLAVSVVVALAASR
jgi:hypothetical protein